MICFVVVVVVVVVVVFSKELLKIGCSWQNKTLFLMCTNSFGFFSVFTFILFFSNRWHLRFIRSEFRGQLPQPYSPHRNATWVIPEHMNDMNQEEPSRYVSSIPSDCCLFVVVVFCCCFSLCSSFALHKKKCIFQLRQGLLSIQF